MAGWWHGTDVSNVLAEGGYKHSTPDNPQAFDLGKFTSIWSGLTKIKAPISAVVPGDLTTESVYTKPESAYKPTDAPFTFRPQTDEEKSFINGGDRLARLRDQHMSVVDPRNFTPQVVKNIQEKGIYSGYIAPEGSLQAGLFDKLTINPFDPNSVRLSEGFKLAEAGTKLPSSISITADNWGKPDEIRKDQEKIINERSDLWASLKSAGKIKIGDDGKETFVYTVDDKKDLDNLKKLEELNVKIEQADKKLSDIEKSDEKGVFNWWEKDINQAFAGRTEAIPDLEKMGFSKKISDYAIYANKEGGAPELATDMIRFTGEGIESVVMDLKNKPVDNAILAYLGLEGLPALENLAARGVAKLATSESPTIVKYLGKPLSSGIARDTATLGKYGLGLLYLADSASYILGGDDKSPEGYGKRTGSKALESSLLFSGSILKHKPTLPDVINPLTNDFTPLQRTGIKFRTFTSSFDAPPETRAAYRASYDNAIDTRYMQSRPGITETTPARSPTEPDISLAQTIGKTRAPVIRDAIGEQPHVMLGSVVMEGQKTGLPTSKLLRGAKPGGIHDIDVRVDSEDALRQALAARGETPAGIDFKPFEEDYPWIAGRKNAGSDEGIRRTGWLTRLFGEPLPNQQGYKLPKADEVQIAGKDYPGKLNQEPFNVQLARKQQAFAQDLVPAEGKAGNVDARELNEQFRLPKDFYDQYSMTRDLVAGDRAARIQAGEKNVPKFDDYAPIKRLNKIGETEIKFDFMPREDIPIIGAKTGQQFTKKMTLNEIVKAYETDILGGGMQAGPYTWEPPRPSTTGVIPSFVQMVKPFNPLASGGIAAATPSIVTIPSGFVQMVQPFNPLASGGTSIQIRPPDWEYVPPSAGKNGGIRDVDSPRPSISKGGYQPGDIITPNDPKLEATFAELDALKIKTGSDKIKIEKVKGERLSKGGISDTAHERLVSSKGGYQPLTDISPVSLNDVSVRLKQSTIGDATKTPVKSSKGGYQSLINISPGSTSLYSPFTPSKGGSAYKSKTSPKFDYSKISSAIKSPSKSSSGGSSTKPSGSTPSSPSKSYDYTPSSPSSSGGSSMPSNPYTPYKPPGGAGLSIPGMGGGSSGRGRRPASYIVKNPLRGLVVSNPNFAVNTRRSLGSPINMDLIGGHPSTSTIKVRRGQAQSPSFNFNNLIDVVKKRGKKR
jgi:hypothetical protein